MKVLVINGPNMNMLGVRETNIYGTVSYKQLIRNIHTWAKELNLCVDCVQSNYEGKIIDYIQKSKKYDAIVINAAAYTHTSIAIHDALKTVNKRVIEVHVSDVNNREEYRKVNYIKDCAEESIINEGIEGYKKALALLKNGGK